MLATIDNKAKKVVEGLFLDISTIGRVYLNPAVFSRMHNLRLLKFYWSSWLKKEGTGSIFESSGSDCLKSLPNKLRLLHWEEYPFKSLPLNFSMENLVHLNMRNSKVEKLWNGVKIMESSEVLPSSNNGIVILDLRGCKMLNSLPNSTWELKRLEILNLHGCSYLEKLPPLYGLCSLKKLFLDDTALVDIPPDIVSLSSLELLSLSDTPMEELPSSIGCLSSLVSLNLQRCKKLKSLPNSICELKCLKTLHLRGCSDLEKLPPLYGLCSLRDLYLDGTALVKIPLDIFSLSSLGIVSK
ncbi:hypothetical protein GH714_018597 [Hevea brasiliensis]|uniref:Disease resistance R13L4/SHOC-2-like LRR domain-containing protein n=1 Tax=Hevea brasiliensis TaxID=3981 RepID=A0A6A6L6W3_HEVBR|nr:hypothetical protein GH714_018597 [Hevea brasiliensis]